MSDDFDVLEAPPPHRRREDDGIPNWAKLALSVAGTTIVALGWMELRFVSRVEWANHQAQQALDMSEMKESQKSYAIAEKVTSNGLQSLTVDVAEIKNDVSWLRAYLDVSKPLPKNGKK